MTTTDAGSSPAEVTPSYNRRLIAQRLGDPEGSVDACERIERTFVGLHVMWARENRAKGFEGPAGFYATTGTAGRIGWRDRAAYGATEEDLVAALRELGSAQALYAREEPSRAQYRNLSYPPWGAGEE